MSSRLALVVLLTLATPMADVSPAAEKPVPKVSANHSKEMAHGLELFKSHVRNILTESCLKCHGGKKTEGDFDLASRERLLEGGSFGPAIVPGKAEESLLVKLIAHADEPAMPYEADKLPEQSIAHIKAWINAGAPYDSPLVEGSLVAKGRANVTDADRQFWSFRPLTPKAPPSVKNESWVKTPIDRFILAKLEAEGIAPNAPIDRRRLIRRASFDLIGLPPTPEEIDAFINDKSPDAYSKVIDRLLASPRHGERWARHWLDLARFAESHGYEQDYDRPTAYHYRDFVIQALNQDMGYDRFVKLQLAGDEFEPDNHLAMMATGFLAAGTHATQITANQVEKERYDELDDMTATVGTAMLGMTIGCARCHDHKFDPIPTSDYYRLLSTFTTAVRSEVDLDFHPERYRKAKAEFDEKHAPLAAALAKFEKDELPGRLDNWLAGDPKPPKPRWQIVDLEAIKSEGGATFARQEDGSYLAGGNNPANDTYTLIARTTSDESISAIRLEALTHPSLGKSGPGRSANANFALANLTVTVAPADGKTPPASVKLVDPKATFEQKDQPVAAAIDADGSSVWGVDPQLGKDHAAVFHLEKPVSHPGGCVLTISMRFAKDGMNAVGRPRIAISAEARPVALDGEQAPHKLVQEIAEILKTPAGKMTEKQRTALMAWFRTTDADWRKLNDAVVEHRKSEPRPELTKVLVTTEGLPAIRLHTQGADFFEKTFLLKRGDLAQKQGEATQGFLQVLMRNGAEEKQWQVQPPKGWRTSYRRRSLANWITDTDKGAGHLLARVIVNRLWQHHLGRGIVSTPSDFGAQGERPTHPELLDWLATELIQSGWRLKPIHKLIAASAVYMQGTDVDSAREQVDPQNLLFWRRAPQRLEAEVIRDALLAVSGTLDERMFGPGSLDASHRRRSIYFTIKRSQLIPMMMLFDAPDSLQGLGLRSSTTIAPQALAMLNNQQVVEYSAAFAKRLIVKGSMSPAELVETAYRLAFGRSPAKDEMSAAVEFLKGQTQSYQSAGKANAEEMALGDLCQTLMLLNEFVFVE